MINQGISVQRFCAEKSSPMQKKHFAKLIAIIGIFIFACLGRTLSASEYTECRLKALQEVSKTSKIEFKTHLEKCDQLLASGELLEDCKRDAAKKFGKGAVLPENAMGYCRKLQDAMTYMYDEDIPAHPIAGRLFYAGFDLSASRPLEAFSKFYPECSPLEMEGQVASSLGSERLFDFLSNYGDLPIGYCVFNALKSPYFSKHIFFFRIDRKSGLAVPLAVRSVLIGSDEKKLEALSNKLATQLGPLKIVHSTPGSRSFLISDKGIWSFFDQNRLCEKNLSDHEVAWLSNPIGKSEVSELVVINRKNLCRGIEDSQNIQSEKPE